MYIAIVYRDSTLRVIEICIGLFSSFDSAATYALDKYPAPFAVVVKYMDAIL